jgi:hypothetical protein
MKLISRPHVLFVDDNPDELRELRRVIGKKAKVEVRSPEEVTMDDLRVANLVLVDYQIQVWPERDLDFSSTFELDIDGDTTGIARQPPDGLALIAVLRSLLWHRDRKAKPTAFALNSAHLRELAGTLPTQRAPQILARRNNLEWAFAKNSPPDELYKKIIDLAIAVQCLGKVNWAGTSTDPEKALFRLLNINDKCTWRGGALKDVLNCHPPIHQIDSPADSLLVLQWLLTRILPYPCFLYDVHYLAIRLHLDTQLVIEDIASNGPIKKLFAPARYNGALNGFSGDRWWRAGVDHIIWKITHNADDPKNVLVRKIYGNTGTSPGLSSIKNPVICLNAELEQVNTFNEIDDCARIQPDDWPPYADGAWALISEIKTSPELASLVTSSDRERIS